MDYEEKIRQIKVDEDEWMEKINKEISLLRKEQAENPSDKYALCRKKINGYFLQIFEEQRAMIKSLDKVVNHGNH